MQCDSNAWPRSTLKCQPGWETLSIRSNEVILIPLLVRIYSVESNQVLQQTSEIYNLQLQLLKITFWAF